MSESDVIDKLDWGPGEWLEEPDEKYWVDESNRYNCAILRSPVTGSLCGYVQMSDNHPFVDCDYDHIDVSVHGRLIYKEKSLPTGHNASESQLSSWIGFDTSHVFDIMPRIRALLRSLDTTGNSGCRKPSGEVGFNIYDEQYRDMAYVASEVESLAAQIKALESS